ncbi:MAG: hypothetical protein K6E16_03820 [Lachnospiraceae bacterium]|nr:hypothetical protein [Lachnospiraceae bacterium]
MNEKLKNAQLDPDDLEQVTGGVHRPNIISKAEQNKVPMVCKNCHQTYFIDAGSKDTGCPHCPGGATIFKA